MKKWMFLMMMGLVTVVLASDTKSVTVQVISAVHEKSITDAFNEKLKKTGLEIYKKNEGERFVVTLGEYKDDKHAQPALKKARTIVNKEAFIRPVNRENTTQVTVISEHNISSKGVAAHPATSPTEQAAIAVVVIPTSSEKSATVSSPLSSPVVNKVVLRRESHKNEISDALDFYKTSPYYRFEPVTLRQ